MSDEQTQVYISDLVEWINGREAELFQKYDSTKGRLGIAIKLLLALFFATWIVLFVYELYSVIKGRYSFELWVIGMSTALAAFAIVLAGLSCFNLTLKRTRLKYVTKEH